MAVAVGGPPVEVGMDVGSASPPPQALSIRTAIRGTTAIRGKCFMTSIYYCVI